jgi:hypothetical protein
MKSSLKDTLTMIVGILTMLSILTFIAGILVMIWSSDALGTKIAATGVIIAGVFYILFIFIDDKSSKKEVKDNTK